MKNEKSLYNGIKSTVALCIIFATLIDASNLFGVTIGDELGYWGIGAFLNDYDWSELLSTISYYSYGYGLFLSLILKLNISSQYIYRIAILMNGFFLSMSFLVLCNIIEYYNIQCKIKKNQIITISFICILYTGCFSLKNLSWTESLLVFLYITSIYSLIRIKESPTLTKIILFYMQIFLLYISHQRTIPILIIGILIILYFSRTSISLRKFSVIILVIFFSLLGHGIFKEYLVENVFSSNILLSNNDYTGVMNRLNKFTSLEGLRNVLISICGKTYYLIISTLGVIVWGTVFLIYIIKVKLKRRYLIRKKIYDLIIEIYILGSSFGALAISVIYLSPEVGESFKDMLGGYIVYGRYNEYIVAPILAIGMLFLFSTLNTTEWKKSMCYLWLLLCIITFIVYVVLREGTGVSTGIWNVGLMPYFQKDTSANIIVYAFLITVLFQVVLMILLEHKKIGYIMCVGIMVLVFIYSNKILTKSLFVKNQNNLDDFVSFLDEKKIFESIYILDSADAFYIQFYEKEKEIKLVNEKSNFSEAKNIILLGNKNMFKYLVEYEYDEKRSVYFVANSHYEKEWNNYFKTY